MGQAKGRRRRGIPRTQLLSLVIVILAISLVGLPSKPKAPAGDRSGSTELRNPDARGTPLTVIRSLRVVGGYLYRFRTTLQPTLRSKLLTDFSKRKQELTDALLLILADEEHPYLKQAVRFAGELSFRRAIPSRSFPGPRSGFDRVTAEEFVSVALEFQKTQAPLPAHRPAGPSDQRRRVPASEQRWHDRDVDFVDEIELEERPVQLTAAFDQQAIDPALVQRRQRCAEIHALSAQTPDLGAAFEAAQVRLGDGLGRHENAVAAMCGVEEPAVPGNVRACAHQHSV